MRHAYLLPLAALLLAACAGQSTAATAEPTAQPSNTLKPTSTIIAEITETANTIAVPGPRSLLVSPIIIPIEEEAGTFRAELRTGEGNLLARAIPGSGQDHAELFFEVGEEQDALMVLAWEDAFGRMERAYSVPVHLLPSGTSALSPVSDERALEIQKPAHGSTSFSGTVLVEGVARIPEGRALNVRLVTRTGRVLVTRDIYLEYADGEDAGTFSVELTANLEESTWVQVVVYSSRGGAILYLESVEIRLAP